MSAIRLSDHVDRGDQQAERLHHRHVAVGDGVDQAGADAGEAEDVLDDDDAAGQPGEVEGDHLDGRHDGVGQGVAPEHDVARRGP